MRKPRDPIYDLVCGYMQLLTVVTEEEIEEANVNVLWTRRCRNTNYTVVARAYMFGQVRLQLCDSRVEDIYSPLSAGGIVQEMCTYDKNKAQRITGGLALAADPLVYARMFATSTNCEGEGMRIRLDDKAEDHVLGFSR